MGTIFPYTGAAGWLKATLARPDVAGKYSGILNGIDTQAWDPATDPFLPACYSPALPQGKALCKEYLQRAFGMTVDPRTPLVAVISRLVPQKGIHLIEHAAARTLQLGRVMITVLLVGWVCFTNLCGFLAMFFHTISMCRRPICFAGDGACGWRAEAYGKRNTQVRVG